MTRKPQLLDLFCCAGGAGTGYARAGFEVVGVDVEPQPHYPFEFHRRDALDVLANGWKSDGVWPGVHSFDAIHASPPCQRWSDLAKRNGNAADWPDLITPTRKWLEASGLPWIMENVEGAPLRADVTLCGTMFSGLRVIRHRLFESNVPIVAPAHGAHPLVFTHDKRKAHYGKLDQGRSFVQVTGGGNCTMDNARDAMGCPWMRTKHELNEAIPPAYTEYLGFQLRAALILERRQHDGQQEGEAEMPSTSTIEMKGGVEGHRSCTLTEWDYDRMGDAYLLRCECGSTSDKEWGWSDITKWFGEHLEAVSSEPTFFAGPDPHDLAPLGPE